MPFWSCSRTTAGASCPPQAPKEALARAESGGAQRSPSGPNEGARPVGGRHPELLLVRLAVAELAPGLVRLRHHLQGFRPRQGALLEAEAVQRLLVRRLVPPEPLADAGHHAPALGLDVADVLELRRQRVVRADADDLPVQLAIIDHRQHAQDLHGLDRALGQRHGADLHDVHGVVVARALGHGVLDAGVLPGLREHAVVPEDGPVVVAELALLHVLRDWAPRLLGVHLHLVPRHLRNLDDAVEDAVLARVQRHVVPRRDVPALGVLEAQPVLHGALLAVGLRRHRLRQL
mmetsp:Transcript_16624/g.52328  ORF Transcript_16624/g.52328 Transcript_16624/m.52328 type:complete len:290 (-) Transcript_16624:195-1064(-)